MSERKGRKFVEPETASSFGIEYEDTNGMCRLGDETCSHNSSVFEVPIRIIREKDYQRMKKLCQHAKRGRK